MSVDLFGRPLPKRFPARKPVVRELFGGDAWLDAAKDLVALRGLTFDGMDAGQRVKASGQWFDVAWNDDGRGWELRPVA